MERKLQRQPEEEVAAGESEDERRAPLLKPDVGRAGMKTIHEDEDEDEHNQAAEASDAAPLPEWFLSRETLEVDKWKHIGKGGFGCIYCAEWLHSTVAAKLG